MATTTADDAAATADGVGPAATAEERVARTSVPPPGAAPTELRPDGARGDGEPFRRSLPWLMLVGGALGLVASADLNIERTRLLADPDYVPSCSLNVLLDCGAVASSPQASVLGFSNTVLGIAAFAVVVGLASVLVTGGRLTRAVWLGLNAGLLVGVGFVHWLIYTSAVSLSTLCPWCMVVWSVTVPLFWYVTLRNLGSGEFGARVRDAALTRTLLGLHAAPVLLWFAVVAAYLGIRFADSWAAML